MSWAWKLEWDFNGWEEGRAFLAKESVGQRAGNRTEPECSGASNYLVWWRQGSWKVMEGEKVGEVVGEGTFGKPGLLGLCIALHLVLL